MYKKILASALSALMISGTLFSFAGCNGDSASSSAASDGEPSSNAEPSAPDAADETSDSDAVKEIAEGAILQAFSWDFNTIKNSMADIAAAGFTSVQTSPINECLEGDGGGMELYGNGKWYYHYQPTDFKIGNYQLGTRDEFKAMCDEADKYGVKIIVDIIANHTTPQLDKVSEDLVEAGGGSFDTLFHENNQYDIKDYGDRLACTTYKMGGLPDINTERPSFQDYFIKFVNDCIDCGADGFRYDTAKHIGLPDDPKEDDGFENNFWERVTTDIHKAGDIFIYGEVLQGNNDRIADYIKAIGRTTSSTYGSKIRAAVTNNFVDTSSVSEYWLGDAPLKMVTWVESHDNYINDGTWANMTADQVILGWSIISARKDGTPLFFSRPYFSSTSNEWGMNRIGVQGDDMYKDARVQAVNLFRKAMAGEDENLQNPDEDSTALIIERGTKGAVIVNVSDELKVDFPIALADGEYTDRVDKKTVYTVKDGKLTCKTPIPENSVVVLYNDNYTEPPVRANVGVAEDTEFVIDSDKTEVTLTLTGADSGSCTVNGGEEKSFKDGDKITVSIGDNNIGVLELRAVNPDKTVTYERIEFTYKKSYEIKKGAKVYFEKPDDWGDDIYAYVYTDDDDENDDWPGEEMKKESDGRYSYTFEYNFDTPYIIFNEGDDSDSFQYPEGRGLEVVDGKTYKVEN